MVEQIQTAEITIAIAKEEGIELTEEHWQVIYVLREFYNEHKVSPSMRALINTLNKKFGKGKFNSITLHQLFPKGPAIQASKIAGLPKPVRCI